MSTVRTPDEVLEAALRKERASRAFYAAMRAQCRIAMVTDLLDRLEGEEQRHIQMIEEMMTNMRLGRDPL